MKHFELIFICYCIAFPSFHRVLCLKCRTGNQQSDEQFQKIMQVCRRRFHGYERESARDHYARDTDSQESSDSASDEDLFDNKFLSTSGNRYNKNDKSSSGSGARFDYASSSPSRNATRRSSGRNWNQRSYSSGSTGSRSSYDNARRNTRNNGMDSRNYPDNSYNPNNRYNNYNNNMNRNNNDDGYNNDGEREQACIIQCFFNELNLVDQRGFPERSAVTGIMTQNIQDPELRDFVEESIIECYHYLNNNGRQEKCQFSQNLLSCLAEKGSERCEDWDDD